MTGLVPVIHAGRPALALTHGDDELSDAVSLAKSAIRQYSRIPLPFEVGEIVGHRVGTKTDHALGEAIHALGIDPLLDADLLYALRRMGHGDEIAVVDTNYPAASTAMSTVTGEPLLMAGVSAARAVEAILSVMPLDTFVPDPAGRMEVVGDPDAIPPVQREVQAVLDRAAGKHVPLQGIERFDFYERAKNAFVILVTGERRFYGDFIFKKGVVPPE